MLTIHIQTPEFIVLRASDMGEIKAATALAKCFPGERTYTHVNADNPDRWAKVMRANNNVTIKTI